MKTTIKGVVKAVLDDIKIPYHHIQGFLAANHYNYPASGMTVIAVTGTNGKTSTCYMIYHILRKAGLKTAMMTTASIAIDGEEHPQAGHMTTADPRTLNQHIAKMREQGIQFLVLEVSSHALAQGRVFGIPIDIAVLTNITREHLDYHRTMARYTRAKLKLFKMLRSNEKRGGRGIAIINADDSSAKYFTKFKNKRTYGINSGDYKATEIKLTTKNSSYYVRINKQAYHIKVNLIGQCFVYNSLAAVAVGDALELSRDVIEQGIAELAGVEGRMTVVDTPADFNVIVDYAHTPDAYEKILPSTKQISKGKLIVISGATANRDNAKFPLMGELVAKYADQLILTEEDCGKSSVHKLSENVARGARKAGWKDGEQILFIDNRRKAIEKACKLAGPGDTVLMLGVGHQKELNRANGPEPWDEIAIAREIATAISKTSKKSTKKVIKSSKSSKTSKH